MKSIKEWQEVLAEGCKTRFPDSEKWSDQDRLLSILRQLADVSGGIQKEQGIYHHPGKAYDNPDHRIAGALADILILAEKRDVDLEKELQEFLEFYKNKDKPFTV